MKSDNHDDRFQPTDWFQRMSDEQRALYDKIKAIRQANADVPFNILEELRKIREGED